MENYRDWETVSQSRYEEVRSLCDHIVLISGGKAEVFDNIEEGIGMYEEVRKSI